MLTEIRKRGIKGSSDGVMEAEMAVKTDDSNKVGVHVFELAKLGKAPFKMVGTYESVFQAYPGAPKQAGTCCDYCGTGIMQVIRLKGIDGKEFKVGCDCVRRAGDEGILKAYKRRPEVRKREADKRHARERAKIDGLKIVFEAGKDRLAAMTTPEGAKCKNQLEYIEFCLRMSGTAGTIKWLTYAKKLLETNEG